MYADPISGKGGTLVYSTKRKYPCPLMKISYTNLLLTKIYVHATYSARPCTMLRDLAGIIQNNKKAKVKSKTYSM